MVHGLGRLLLDAFAPRRCAGCDTVSPDALCAACITRMSAMPAPAPRRLEAGVAVAGFAFDEPVRSALHRGKYGGDRAALEALARLTVARAADVTARADGMVAVPLGARRRRHRGYNQSEIIAGVIAASVHLPVWTGLDRVRETRPQSSRDEARRQTNVAGAFTWRGDHLGGARAVLVDDVLTTGATVIEASHALVAAGATCVDVIVIAAVV